MAKQTSNIGYRALPATIKHPRFAERLDQSTFEKLEKQKIESAPSVAEGHLGTDIWYCGSDGYVVQVNIQGKGAFFAKSICTFTPTMGMDSIDGAFAEDVEAEILKSEAGIVTPRLDIFSNKEEIDCTEYLKARGIFLTPTAKNEKPWWKFWK